jgi:hypothetical protein
MLGQCMGTFIAAMVQVRVYACGYFTVLAQYHCIDNVTFFFTAIFIIPPLPPPHTKPNFQFTLPGFLLISTN